MPPSTPASAALCILIPIAAAVCLGLGGFFLWVQFNLSYRKKNTAKAGAVLRETNHKKNVRYGFIRTTFVKNLTKALYIYKVNGVEYGIREEFFATGRQTPRMVPVVYLKRFPRFAYMDVIGSFSDIRYGIRSALLLIWGVCLAFITGAIITQL